MLPLDLYALVESLGPLARRFDADLLECCDSTNDRLLERAEAGAPSGTVLIARQQTAGRGRQGRRWLSAPGASLAFSLIWRFPLGTPPAGLSLAAGLACAQALRKVGAGGTAPVQLKWPNDLLLGGRKLGGILIELLPNAPQVAVIGIGLNLRLPDDMPETVRTCSAALPDDSEPNRLLAALLGDLLQVLERFAGRGFAALREEWRAFHAFENAPIQLLSDFAPPRQGICRGVDADGALLFEAGAGLERVLSGEISLRPA